MKKLLGTLFLILFCCSTLYADDRYKPWVYNNVKISEKCLKHLYPLASGDWYEEYYIMSKTHKTFDDLPNIFAQAVNDWESEVDVKPTEIFFIGADAELIKIK